MEGVEWGTVGEWISGLGGLLAVVSTVAFGVMEHRRANAADEAARSAIRRALLAEARQKAALIRVSPEQVFPVPSPRIYAALISNSGESIFRDVVAIATWNETDSIRQQVGNIPPGIGPERVSLEHLGPAGHDPAWRIEYTDLDGRRWSHSDGGDLILLADEHDVR